MKTFLDEKELIFDVFDLVSSYLEHARYRGYKNFDYLLKKLNSLKDDILGEYRMTEMSDEHLCAMLKIINYSFEILETVKPYLPEYDKNLQEENHDNFK